MVSGSPAAARALAASAAPPALPSRLAWALAGHGAAALGALAGYRLLTFRLPPEVFGAVSLLTALATFARALAGFPVLQASLRHFPEVVAAGRVGAFHAVMRHELLRSALLAVAFTLAAGAVARAALGAPLLPFALLGAFLAADTFRQFPLDLLNASGQQAEYAAWSAVEAWARPLLGVLAIVALGASAGAVLGGYLLGAAALALLAAARSPLRGLAWDEEAGDGEARAELRRSLRGFALPLAPLALVGWLTSVGDRYLVGAFAGTGQVGLYAAIYGLASVPFASAQGVLELALRPGYFAAVSARDRAAERRLFRTWTLLSLGVAAVGVALVFALYEPLAALALGPAYRAAAPLMRPIALGLALWMVAAGVEKACYAHKRTHWVLAVQAAGAAAFLAVTPPLVRQRGVAGAAAAVPVYFGLQLAAAVVAARAAIRSDR